MGIIFAWFLGKTEDDLKEMREIRIAALTKEVDKEKVEKLVEEVEEIDKRLAELK